MSVTAQGPPPASVHITSLLSPPASGLWGDLLSLQGNRHWILQNEGAAQRALGGTQPLMGTSLSLELDCAPPCLSLSSFTVPQNLCEQLLRPQPPWTGGRRCLCAAWVVYHITGPDLGAGGRWVQEAAGPVDRWMVCHVLGLTRVQEAAGPGPR